MSKMKAGLQKIEEWILIDLKHIPFFHGLYWQLKQFITGTFMEQKSIGQHLEPQTTIYKWMFGETTIFYVMIWNHPIEATIYNQTSIYKWLFGVPSGQYWKNRRFFPWSPSRLWTQGTQLTKQFEASTQLGERQRLKNSNHSWREPTGVGKARGFP